MAAEGDNVGSAHVDIHVNSGPGEAELAAFKAKVDRDFEELGRKKASAELNLKKIEFDKEIDAAKAQLDYFKKRRASATLDLAKGHFDEQIAAAEAELKALTSKKRTIQIDSRQVRAAHTAEKLLAKERALSERAALQSAKAERALANERSKGITDTIRARSELAKLSDQYEKLRGKQLALEKSSRRVFSSRSIGTADKEARKLERVGAEAELVAHKIERLGGSVAHLDPAIQRNNTLLGRWLDRLGNTSIRIGPITTSLKGLGTGLSLLGPLIFELGGGLVSLVGTIGEGLAGAATVGAGALAGFATSAAGVGFVIGPMVGEFKEVTAASAALHKAQLKYGAGSKQVADAQEHLNTELHGVSPIAREAFQSYGGLKDRWKSLTKAARPAVFTAFGESLKTVQSLLPSFASESVKTTKVAGKAWDGWMKSLRSSESKQLLKGVMSDFRASIPGLADGLASLGAMIGRLSAAGAHFLPGLSHGFAEWADNLERAVGGGQDLQSNVGRMVGQMQDFGHLTQHTGSLLVHIFDASADSGDGLVKSLDKVIQRWDKWTQSAAGKEGLKDFFGDSKTATEDFMASLSHLTRLLFEFSRATAPVANGLLKVVTFIGDVVSAADDLVGVKQVFQGLGLVLAGLWVTSKAIAFTSTIQGATRALYGLAAGEEAVAAAQASGGVGGLLLGRPRKSTTIATTGEDAAKSAAKLGVLEGAAAGTALELETAAASAGLLATVLAPEVLIPAGVIVGLGALVIATDESSRSIVDMEADFRKAGHEISNSLASSSTATDKYVAAQHRNIKAANDVSDARKHLIKLQKEDAPMHKITKAVEAWTAAEHKQNQAAHQTGVTNREQIDAQKKLAQGAKNRVDSAKEEIKWFKRRVAEEERKMGTGGGTQLGAVQDKLARAERDLAAATHDVTNARTQNAAASVPYERSLKNLKPISESAERALQKLAGTIGASATKKLGNLVNPQDVERATKLGTELAKAGRAGQVKNIAVNSQGADQTIAKLRRLQKQTNAVETARATVHIGANDTQANSKLKALSRLSQRVTGAKNTVNILANASGAQDAIHKLQSNLRQLAAHDYKAKIGAIDNASSVATNFKRIARQEVEHKYTAHIEAIDNASNVARKAGKSADDAGRKKPKIAITATASQAFSVLGSVNAKLEALNGKKATTEVVTKYRSEGRPGKAEGGPGAYVSGFASGGINDRELQRANEKAVYRQAGPSRRITRPTMLVGEQAPQHDEYVIATNPAFRVDNERYLEQAAGELGKEVVPAYAKGKGKSRSKKSSAASNKKASPSEVLAKHPPKPSHRGHKIAKVDKWGPVAAYNQAEIDAQTKEEIYGQVYQHDEAEIRAERMDQWEFARMRSLLSDQAADYRHLGTLVPDIRNTVNKELGRIHGLIDGKGEFSKTALKNLNHQEAIEKAKLGKLKQGKNESDSAFRKRKRPFEHSITKLNKEKHQKEKERSRLTEIRAKAKQELSEVSGARKINKNKTAMERSEDELQYIEDVESGIVEAPYAEDEEKITPEMEYAKAALVRAEIEHNTGAEEAARKQITEVAEREYSAAIATPSPKDDIEKGEQLKQIREEAANNGGNATLGEQTASYNEARAQLYQQFASNIFGQLTPTAHGSKPAVGASGGSPTYVPAGMTAMAYATPALQPSSTKGGEGKIEVVNNFAAPPPDAHTWTRQQEFELGALA